MTKKKEVIMPDGEELVQSDSEPVVVSDNQIRPVEQRKVDKAEDSEVFQAVVQTADPGCLLYDSVEDRSPSRERFKRGTTFNVYRVLIKGSYQAYYEIADGDHAGQFLHREDVRTPDNQ